MDNAKWRPPSLLWIMLCISGGLVFAFNVLEIQTYSLKRTYLAQPRAKVVAFPEEMRLKGFLVRTPGCTIPDMDAMDETVKSFIFEEEKVICNNGVPALFESNATSLYLLESSLPHYSINESELLTCCYQPFRRVDPKNHDTDMEVKFDECRDFVESVNVKEEFVRVTCKYNETDIYKDFFNFVPLKNASGGQEVPGDSLNVLLVGLDAVSRLNLHRQMPKTVGYLSKLGAVEMMGYNKVGDNTFPNLMPVLAGLSEGELKNVCYPKAGSYFDRCPFVWKEFQQAGYTTAFGEDSAWMGLFYYMRKGFKSQPTDYYFDHWDITSTKQIGNMHRMNVDQCVGARVVYKVFLDYIEKFAETMRTNRRPFFGFFWEASLTHDYLNKPKLGDQDYYDLLYKFNRTGVMNNTALIFLSDHGIRWGDIRSTYQGRMEERLPFLYVVLPKWFRQRNSALSINLQTNRRRLTTPFDLHETIKDLLNSNNLTDRYITDRSYQQVFQRGYSLFDRISVNRTCEDASIAPHWCTCQTSKSVAVDDDVVIEAANYTVQEHMNELLAGYADCAYLEIDEIMDARLQVNTETLPALQAQFSEDYTVTFRTKPGGGVFEATLRKTNDQQGYHFNITGTVSRINLYGKQSLCITDFHLKLYCYCKKYVSN